MTDRTALIAAFEAWQNAEHNYQEQNTKHIVAWWGTESPNPPEPMTLESLVTLQELRGEIDATLAAYRTRCQAHVILEHAFGLG